MTTKDFQTKTKLNIFLSYFKKHKGLFIFDISCAIVTAIIEIVYPYVSRIAMNTLLPGKAYKAFFTVMGIMVLAYIVKAVLNYLICVYGHRFGTLVEIDIKKDLFAHMQLLSFSFFDKNRTGQLQSRITTDLFDITELAHHGPEDVVISVVTIIGSLGVMLTIEWRLALIVALLIPLFVVFLTLIKGWREKAFMNVKVSLGHVNTEIESALSGMRTAKAFTNEASEKAKFDAACGHYANAKGESYKSMGVFNSGMEFFCTIITVAVMVAGGYFIMKESMDYVDLITFSLYVNAFVIPIRKLVNFTEVFASGNAGLTRFIEIMKLEPEVADKEDAKELVMEKAEIRFTDISFAYKDNLDVLKHINLEIKPGETLAVVGASGGGKTTLCQLLPRFYDVDSGSITIDGQDLRDLTQCSLRSQIGIVQQDVFLFAASVMDNIRYGKPNATDEEVIAAAKKAEIYDDIMKMPEGFDTFVGERGVLLSGGQKQRVAIARIFLKNPPILILDEATSALDSVTESRIQGAFDELAKGRTTLIIAHRLSTIRGADRIIAIEDGQIVEEGTHKQLLEKGGVYAKLYSVQTS